MKKLLLTMLWCVLILTASCHRFPMGEDIQDSVASDNDISITAVMKDAMKYGSSLKDIKRVKGLQDQSYPVSASGSIENYSKWYLKLVTSEVSTGRANVSPRSVAPAMKEGFASHSESRFKATGTWVRCTFSASQSLVHFMYSVPFSHDLHANWLALAICKNNYYACKSLNAKKMYYKKYRFMARKRYYYKITPVKYCSQRMCIIGQMTTDHHAEIHIRFYPRHFNDLEKSMRLKAEEVGLGEKEYAKFIKHQFNSDLD